MIVKFYLDKPRSEHATALYVHVRLNGVGTKSRTLIRLLPHQFDVKKQLCRSNHPDQHHINAFLDSIRSSMMRLWLTEFSGRTMNRSALKNLLSSVLHPRTEEDAEDDFTATFQKFLDSKRNDLTVNTLKKYRTLLNLLNEYSGRRKRSLDFSMFDEDFVGDFEDFLFQVRDQVNSTVGKYVSCLKTYLKWAHKRGHLHLSAFQDYKVRETDGDIIVLREDEIKAIQEVELDEGSTLDKIRDVFLFQLQTGQRFSDVQAIRSEDLRGDTWSVLVIKTKQELQVPLGKGAKQILQKYSHLPRPLPRYSEQYTNRKLKQLAKLAGITRVVYKKRKKGTEVWKEHMKMYEVISTHCARRSFVTGCLENDVPQTVIVEVTGHRNERNFRRYVNHSKKYMSNKFNSYFDQFIGGSNESGFVQSD